MAGWADKFSVNDKQEWMGSIAINTNNAVYNLSLYKSKLEGFLARSESGPQKKMLKWHISKIDKIMEGIATSKTSTTRGYSGIISKVASKVGLRLFASTLNTYSEVLGVITCNYIKSIDESKPAHYDNGIMVSIGNIAHMMKETNFTRRVSRKRRKNEQRRYIASSGPWSGKEITGYFYFQEFGFTVGDRFIMNKVFLKEDLLDAKNFAITELRKEVRRILKAKGSF